MAMPAEQLRSVGLSAAKASYVRKVAQFHLEHGLTQRRFAKLSDDEAVAFLMQIKGIGRWTAHIVLIAALGREDIFPIDDLILQKMIVLRYGIPESDRKTRLEAIAAVAERWRPFRSFASRCLWHSCGS